MALMTEDSDKHRSDTSLRMHDALIAELIRLHRCPLPLDRDTCDKDSRQCRDCWMEWAREKAR